MKVISRTKESIKALLEMIEYINTISDTKEMTMAEIGVYKGDATKVFCQHFEKVYAVDPWDQKYMNVAHSPAGQIYAEFIQNMKGIKNYYVLRRTSVNAAKYFLTKRLDMAYIDAQHDYENMKQDLSVWLQKIKLGGFISGHDYRNKFPGVVKAVNEILGKPDKVFKDGSWIGRIE